MIPASNDTVVAASRKRPYIKSIAYEAIVVSLGSPTHAGRARPEARCVGRI